MEKIREQAATAKMTISCFVRQSIGHDAPSNFDKPTLPELKTAARLARISSGLGYLLRLCEQRKDVPIDPMFKYIHEIKTVIWDVVSEIRERR
jgi:hypothetical protein